MLANAPRLLNNVRPTLSGRRWGDGATSQAIHRIVTISYAEDLIVCSCGAWVTGIGDGTAWRTHGGKVFEGRGFEARVDSEGPEPTTADRVDAALENIIEVFANCTCATALTRDCPNYVEGDEEDEVLLD